MLLLGVLSSVQAGTGSGTGMASGSGTWTMPPTPQPGTVRDTRWCRNGYKYWTKGIAETKPKLASMKAEIKAIMAAAPAGRKSSWAAYKYQLKKKAEAKRA